MPDSENYGVLIDNDGAEGRPFGKVWWISAPWAHPLWQNYMVSLVDLTTPTPTPPKIGLVGATHEVLVYALDPAHPRDSVPPRLLTPANHGYQFIAETNADAEARIFDLVQKIGAGLLSPDTDFTRVWDALFEDGMSLKASALSFLLGKAVH